MLFSRRKYRHEAFISHAVEDKAAIADELNARLKAEGLKVWYSGSELIIGGEIHTAIEEALDESRFGIVVLTKTFFNSGWTQKELSWLEKREKGNEKVILPVLHEMTIEELGGINPRIASKFCIEAHRGMDYVVGKIQEEIAKEKARQAAARKKAITLISFIIFLFLLLASYISYTIYTHRPPNKQIQTIIEARIHALDNTIETRYAVSFKPGILITQHQIDSVKLAYNNFKSYYRNEYEFNNGNTTIRARKNVENYLHCNLVELADQPGYGMDSLDAYRANQLMADGFRHAGFSLFNKRPVEFTWQGRGDGSLYVVDVTYTNAMRYINVSFTFPPSLTGTKRHEMSLMGFPPSETYYFEEGSDGEWYFKKVE